MRRPLGPRIEWRTVNGILLLDKPEGLSSNAALQRARRLYRARKAGHTGSLDPLASGVLPLCFGEATKWAGYLLDADKTYRASLALGARTATGDREGAIVETMPVAAIDEAAVDAVLARFVGESLQVPPMYSALKVDGETLYARARRGEVVEREARRIRIALLQRVGLAPDRVDFEVVCSKGTYVRTLGEDIARALGTVGHLAALRRTAVGGAFAGQPLRTLEEIESAAGDLARLDAWLIPMDAALTGVPALHLAPADLAAIRHGQAVRHEGLTAGPLRLYGPDGEFAGLGEADDSGQLLRPLRLLHVPEQDAIIQ